MIVRKLRLKRGWSQEQLAEMAGLSVRTIQRIERGQKAGLESLKSLAAVFDVELSNLYEDKDMTIDTPQTNTLNNDGISWEEQRALEYVRDVKAFYSSLATYLMVVPALFILNYFTSPGYFWAWWVLFGWGLGIVMHALSVFEVFSFLDANWEKKQVEKRLKRKL